MSRRTIEPLRTTVQRDRRTRRTYTLPGQVVVQTFRGSSEARIGFEDSNLVPATREDAAHLLREARGQ